MFKDDISPACSISFINILFLVDFSHFESYVQYDSISFTEIFFAVEEDG